MRISDWSSDVCSSDLSREDESIVFSWIEWPDKATRQAMADRIDEIMKSDERFTPEKNPMPFDGARMIYGGFDPVVQEGASTLDPYVQGFILPVSEGKKEAYREAAMGMGEIRKATGGNRKQRTTVVKGKRE